MQRARAHTRVGLLLVAALGTTWVACGRLVDYDEVEQTDEEPPCEVTAETDPDGDGVCSELDCRPNNPFCSLLCTDADGDDRCVDHDCDDTSVACGADCTDRDSDGVSDCKDTCVDADDDGVCAGDDCDDDAVTGGRCYTGCITAYLDRDADGHGGADSRPACELGPGLAARSDDCADLPAADPACGGLGGASCHSGQSELCGDGIDNDCDTAVDCADTACNRLPCDDGLFCTVSDQCSDGVCVGTGDPCGPASDGDCIACDELSDQCSAREAAGEACDDGVFCNGLDKCDESGACSTHAGNPCSTAACSGMCSEGAQTCESIAAGNCFIDGGCFASGDRNPNNPCQECRANVSQTQWTVRGGTCDDGNACTYDDACSDGACVGTAVTCTSDAGTCGTQRTCNGTATCTVTTPGTSTACDDGNACTHTDRCNGFGSCAGTSITCTSDPGPCGAQRSCNGTSTCSVAYAGGATVCDDGAACTHTDRCNGAGGCAGTSITCTSDPGPCGMQRTCNGTATCATSYPGPSTSCNDGAACTHTDRCNGAGGCTGTSISCSNDPGPCGAQRSCNGTSSCAVTYAGNTTSCDDGNLCTYTDRCNGAGACAGTAITCSNGAGTCGIQRSCNGTSSCTESYPGNTTVCDDAKPCTHTDRCNGAGSCSGIDIVCTDDPGTCGLRRTCNGTATCATAYPGSTTVCSDGNGCTHTDRCNGAGACVGQACSASCGASCSYVTGPHECAWTSSQFESGWCTEGEQTRFYMQVNWSCDCQAASCSDAGNTLYSSCTAGYRTAYVCCYHGPYGGVWDCSGTSCY